MKKLIYNATIFAEDKKIEKGWILFNDKILYYGEGEPTIMDCEEKIDACGKAVIPGLIDMQANGGGGNLFMDATQEAIENILCTHVKHGVTGLLATTVAWSDEEQFNALSACADYCEKASNGTKLLGVHMEGPFINPAKAGAHNKKFLKEPSCNKLKEFVEKGRGIVKLITVAPELENCNEMIRYAVEQGICVSAGHSIATYNDMQGAIDSGLRMATHLFNTMNGVTARDPGIVGAIIDSSSPVFGSLVCDGVHVHPANLKALYKCAGADKIILITDCAPIAGTDKKEWMLENFKVTIKGYTGYLDNGTIAGSCLTLNKACMIAKRCMGATTEEVLKMGALNPAIALNISDSKGSIKIGKDADLAVINNDVDFDVYTTVVEGKIVYKR